MTPNDRYKSSIELVRILANSLHRGMPIVSAKQIFCGATLPISDFHSAMHFAENNGWICYSRDGLSIQLP